MRNALTFSFLALSACTTIDDWGIPIPPVDDAGDDGGDDPDPQLPGAWEPCDGWDDSSCSPVELGCFLPEAVDEVTLTGHCTWICNDDGDCADLAVGKNSPVCLPYKEGTSACQLPCETDEACPEGMTCKAIEVYPGGQGKVCVYIEIFQ